MRRNSPDKHRKGKPQGRRAHRSREYHERGSYPAQDQSAWQTADPGTEIEATGASPTSAQGGQGRWHPAVDIIEEDSSWLIEVAIPGADDESLQLTRNADHLVIEGELSSPPTGTPIYQERPRGHFLRKVNLPYNSDVRNVEASYYDGLLKINIPKQQHAAGGEDRIEIQSDHGQV